VTRDEARPDFLMRVSRSHGTPAWSYEPPDAKLAPTAKVQGLLQLCFYSELLGGLQGIRPERMTLVLGDMREETFTTARYEAYFRWVRRRLEEAIVSPLGAGRIAQATPSGKRSFEQATGMTLEQADATWLGWVKGKR
jgi:hypothetical protein